MSDMPGDTSCCVKGFAWSGSPAGKETTLSDNKTYITGPEDSDVAIMVIHDALGWTFANTRILADHYAREVNATVYLPDFFGGEVLPAHSLLKGPASAEWKALDIPAFVRRNSKAIREPELVKCAEALRSKYKKVGMIGFCYGGWAVFRLGSKERNPAGKPLVDCISTGHPSFLEKEEMSKVAVPAQILAPEHDNMLTPELKTFANEIIPTLGVPYDYQYFPGVEHGFCTRGDENDIAEMKASVRAKNAAVYWFKQWLYVN